MTYALTILANTTTNLSEAFYSNDANKILAGCVIALAVVIVVLWRDGKAKDAEIKALQSSLYTEAKQRADMAEKSVSVFEAVNQKLETTRRR